MIRINLCFTPPPHGLGDVTEGARASILKGVASTLDLGGVAGWVGEGGTRGGGRWVKRKQTVLPQ